MNMCSLNVKRAKSQKERDLKELILRSALEEFCQKGYLRGNMRSIAKRAQIAVGTIYKYFPNKKELYKQVFLMKAQNVLEEMKRAFNLTQLSAEDRLKNVLLAKFKKLLEYRDFVKLHIQEFWESSIIGINFKEFKDIYNQQIEIIAKLLVEINGKSIEENIITANIISRIFAFFLIEMIVENKEYSFDYIWMRLKKPVIEG